MYKIHNLQYVYIITLMSIIIYLYCSSIIIIIICIGIAHNILVLLFVLTLTELNQISKKYVKAVKYST